MTSEQLFSIEHALALATEIPGAQLRALDGIGHGLPRPTWDLVVPAILAHTDSAGGAGR